MLKLRLQYLATWCEELTHLKRPWCWERLKAGGEGDDRGWDGWMASPTQWTWVWVSSGSWWWIGKTGMLSDPWGRKESRQDWATELNWLILKGMRWYLIVVLIYISMMVSLEHFFMYLLAICTTFSLENYSGSFSIFQLDGYFFLVNCINIPYILDNKPLSGVWSINIFSHSVSCLFILLMGPLLCRNFEIWYSAICWFLFFFLHFSCHLRNCYQDQCQGAFLLCFLLQVLPFQNLHLFQVVFCEWCQTGVQVHFSCKLTSSFPTTI